MFCRLIILKRRAISRPPVFPLQAAVFFEKAEAPARRFSPVRGLGQVEFVRGACVYDGNAVPGPAAEKTGAGWLTPVVSCTIVALLGWLNYRGISEMLAFAISCYPH